MSGGVHNLGTLESLIDALPEVYQSIYLHGKLIREGVRKNDFERLEVIKKYIKPKQTILDIGSNVGFFTIHLAKLFPENVFVSIENQYPYARLQQELIKLEGVNNIILIHSEIDVEWLEKASQACTFFDVTLLLSVLHHIPNAESFLTQLNKISKSFIIELPHPNESRVCGKEVLRKQLTLEKISQFKPVFIKLPYEATTHCDTNLKRSFYYADTPNYQRESIYPYIGYPLAARNYNIHVNEQGLTIHKTHLNQDIQAIPGVLFSDIAQIGQVLIPSYETCIKQIKNEFAHLGNIDNVGDLRPWNILFTAYGLKFIDYQDVNNLDSNFNFIHKDLIFNELRDFSIAKSYFESIFYDRFESKIVIEHLINFYLRIFNKKIIANCLVKYLEYYPENENINKIINIALQNKDFNIFEEIIYQSQLQTKDKSISLAIQKITQIHKSLIEQDYIYKSENGKNLKIAFDISVLGLGYLHERARTRVFRVVEYILKGLIDSSQFDLYLCSSIPNLSTACEEYLKNEFQHIDLPLFTVSELRLQNISVYHSPFHPIPTEIHYCRKIITVCDLIPIKFPEFFDYKEDSLIKNALKSITDNDFVTCISESTKKDILDYEKRFFDEQVFVTHLAADKNKFYACQDRNLIDNIHQKYQIPKTPYLLSVCTLEPRKNLIHVIRCFLKLIQEKVIDDLNLVLVGTRGWQYDEIFAELNHNANLRQRIIFTGFVPDEDLAPLYSDALAFLYLSLYEGFGLPPLEAMQCGTPVITSNTSSLPEVVGEAGIMLSPNDVDGLCNAIFELYMKPDIREALSLKSLKQSEKFTWEKTLQETINVYKLAAESEFSTPSPKVIIDGVFFQLYKTGIARVWQSLLEQWANTDFANHILVLDRAGTAPKIPGIRYRTVPAYSYNNTDIDREMLQQVCNEEGAELFISTYYTTPTDTPSVFMAYDMIPEVVGADLSQLMWQEKHQGINHASAFIAISGNTAQDITKFFPNIPSDSISVAHCGVDPLFSPASDAEINAFKYQYGINKPYFLLGSLGGYKNSILFFQAFAQLANKQGFDIVVTGASSQLPPEWRQYTAGCTVHGLQLTDEELRLAYAGAVALVYPSKYEGFGMPLVEAMACGCPVITCANGSIPEVAGDAAIYVNDDDVEGMVNAICEVQKPSVRNTLISAGSQQAKQFSWSKMADTVSSVLINTTLLRLNLKEHNFIIFPDWSQPEESVGLELQEIIETLSTHPNRQKTTLLIDTSNITVEDAELFIYSVAMNLFMSEDSDITEELEIALIGNLADIQWQALLPRIQARIVLKYENQEALEKSLVKKLPYLEVEKFQLSKV